MGPSWMGSGHPWNSVRFHPHLHVVYILCGSDSLSVGKVAGVDVLRCTGVLVHANGITLLTVILLLVQVLGVNGTHDIETVTVISSDDDEGVLELADLLEVRDGGADSVVELEKLTEGTVVV